MDNKDFIKSLSEMSQEDKIKLIKKKGKPGKIVPGIIFENYSDRKLIESLYINK